MPIPFTCPYCEFTGRLPDGFPGGRVKCPSCRNSLVVEAEPEAPAAAGDRPRAVEGPPAAGASPVEARTPPVVASPPPRPPEAAATAEEDDDFGLEDDADEDEIAEDEAALTRLRGVAAALSVACLVLTAAVAAVLVRAISPDPDPDPEPRPAPAPAVAGRHALAPQAPPSGPVGIGSRPVGRHHPGTVLRGSPPWGRLDGPSPAAAPAAPTPPPPSPLATAGASAGVDGVPTSPVAAATAPEPTAPAEAPKPADPGEARLEMVRRIKDATVYLKVGAGRESATGTGFVIRVVGDATYVATNHHVVEPPGGRGARGPDGPPAWPPIQAVLRSGEGAGRESTHDAQVVAYDRDENRDLAVLRLVGVADPPRPIDLARAVQPAETTPLVIHGFPFGNLNRMIDRNSLRNPTITISHGWVSRLQLDDAGRLAFVQIDGSIDPGNSGGPVVDEQGRLVGLAVAKLSDSNIGFAVPAAELARMVAGRAGRLRLDLASEDGGEMVLNVAADLIDPFGEVRSIEVLAGPESGPEPLGDGDGGWRELSGASRALLARLGETATGTLRIPSGSGRALKLQVCVRDAAGRATCEKPVSWVVPPRPGVSSPLADGPGGGRRDAEAGPAVAALVDPTRSCKLSREGGVATIEVPAGVHLLGPEFAARPAPMALAEVEGDFDAQVQVAGALLPGVEPAKFKGKTLPNTYQGAGLVLYEDRSNYVRIERGAAATRAQPVASSEIVIEIRDNGKAAAPFAESIPDGPLFLRIQREGGVVRCMFGPGGDVWLSSRQLALRFPDKVRVGLIASNASKEPLSARFAAFSIVQGGETGRE